jgi:hypothetical protein
MQSPSHGQLIPVFICYCYVHTVVLLVVMVGHFSFFCSSCGASRTDVAIFIHTKPARKNSNFEKSKNSENKVMMRRVVTSAQLLQTTIRVCIQVSQLAKHRIVFEFDNAAVIEASHVRSRSVAVFSQKLCRRFQNGAVRDQGSFAAVAQRG